MLIDAAVDGQGVAVARTTLAAWDMLHGRLVAPISVALPLENTHLIFDCLADNSIRVEAGVPVSKAQGLSAAIRRGPACVRGPPRLEIGFAKPTMRFSLACQRNHALRSTRAQPY
jgi:hypothetical protein